TDFGPASQLWAAAFGRRRYRRRDRNDASGEESAVRDEPKRSGELRRDQRRDGGRGVSGVLAADTPRHASRASRRATGGIGGEEREGGDRQERLERRSGWLEGGTEWLQSFSVLPILSVLPLPPA